MFLYIFMEFLHFPKICRDYGKILVLSDKRFGRFAVFSANLEKNIEKARKLRYNCTVKNF
jgi:hypothetical protein